MKTPERLELLFQKTPLIHRMTQGVILSFMMVLCSACHPKLAIPLQEMQAKQYATGWRKIDAYPIPNGRSDDLHFFNKNKGFIINSNGYLSYTEDGGDSWEIRHENLGTFFRCIRFKNEKEGWLGTIGTDDVHLPSQDSIALYETSDSGFTWTPVSFVGPTPKGLCGLQVVNDKFVVGCGRVRGPSYFIKTEDGGDTWYSYNMDHLAGSLIAAYFFDEQHGLLLGGTTRDKKNCRSLVLKTRDGGMNWDTVYLSKQVGEYPWKFEFTSDKKGFISVQRNIKTGKFYHLQTENGGDSWREVIHSPDYYYVQGIGFIDEQIGWMGGSRGQTYETRDGGQSWNKLSGIGSGFNNFQFFKPLAYGVGFGVYKSDDVMKSDRAPQRIFYNNDTLKLEAKMQDGRRNGLARYFHPNGKLEAEGHFKNNLKTGRWNYYGTEGQLLTSVRTRNGTARVSKKQLQKYIGSYRTEYGDFRNITLTDGILYTQRDGGDKLPVFPETSHRFFYAFNTDIIIEFIENDIITHARIRQNGEWTTAVRE